MLFTVISLYFFIMLFAVVYCTAHIRAYNRSLYAKAVLLLCLAICFYIFGYTLELHAESKAQVLFWNKFAYIGIPYIGGLWLWMCLIFTGNPLHRKAPVIIAIFIIPVISMSLRLTNEFHHLYMASELFTFQKGHLLFIRTHGPWMFVQMAHSTSVVILTMILYLREFARNREWKTPKTRLICAATLLLLLGTILRLIQPIAPGLDFMALCLPLACLLVILAVIRYDFLVARSLDRGRVFAESNNAILLVNQANKVIDYNKSAIRLLKKVHVHISVGYMETLFGQSPELLSSLLSSDPSIIRLRTNGEDRYFEITTKGIDDTPSPPGYIKTIRDVTEIYKLNEALAHQALIDDLSGLYNRRAFMQLGRAVLARADMLGQSVHLYMMDLDHFKVVNDHYGHACGDELIRGFSRIVHATFEEECLIARLGGEEFGVLIAGLSDEDALHKAEQLRRDAEEYPWMCDGISLQVTVSIGMTKKANEVQTLDDLLRVADKALYESKDAGRNCVTVI